jgi:hypothetical protein
MKKLMVVASPPLFAEAHPNSTDTPRSSRTLHMVISPSRENSSVWTSRPMAIHRRRLAKCGGEISDASSVRAAVAGREISGA